MAVSFARDRETLEQAGFGVQVLREVPGFVEAEVSSSQGSTLIDWSHDSSFRFFPLVTHPELGLTLHPFDLATNKVLALVGRVEVRDWIDVAECHRQVQPFGYLAWAACGKDPGFGPGALVEHAARTGRYSQAEVDALSFAGSTPDAGELSRSWRAMIEEARTLVARLPPEEAGTCVIDQGGRLCQLEPDRVADAVARGEVEFRPGKIGGSLPIPVG